MSVNTVICRTMRGLSDLTVRDTKIWPDPWVDPWSDPWSSCCYDRPVKQTADTGDTLNSELTASQVYENIVNCGTVRLGKKRADVAQAEIRTSPVVSRTMDNTVQTDQTTTTTTNTTGQCRLQGIAPYNDAIAEYTVASEFNSDIDMTVLGDTYRQLDMCGFYYGRMGASDARHRLRDYPVGAFLLRDSSDSKYLFALSVKTARGTTSVRIAYANGHFRLNQDPTLSRNLPGFDSVLKLVSYYRRVSSKSTSNACVFLEKSGRRDTPIFLSDACLMVPPTLMNACRKVINNSLHSNDVHRQTLLSDELKRYLSDYPSEL